MTTLVTIRDSHGDYATSLSENFPLDYGMLDAGKEFRYSIGTTDTSHAGSALKLAGMIRQVLGSLGRRRAVQKVHISNHIEFVTFNNPRIEITEAYNAYYLEIIGREVVLGRTVTGAKQYTYSK